MAVGSPQDVYARQISSSRGYPIWNPEPGSLLLSHRPEGLRIGDVGVLVPEKGSFDVFFNICLPKDHPFHLATGVPDGFSPISLDESGIKTVRNAESAGQVLTAPSVTRVSGDDNTSRPLRAGQSAATRYSFNLPSREGAILVLPDGADSHDARDVRPFFEQASRHAATWYQFVEENLGRIISHDAIYIITGLHKARSWGIAGYRSEQGNDAFPAQFAVGAHPAESRWETTRNMYWHVGPKDDVGIANQSVCIRGFKIALRNSVQGDVGRGISGKLDVSGEVNSTEGRVLGEDEGTLVSALRTSPDFHPSDVINQYILEKEPSARVAITHDSDWGSLLDRNLLQPGELSQDALLTKIVSSVYDIVLREGVTYLKNENGPDIFVADEYPAPPVRQASISETREPNGVNGQNNGVGHGHPEPLSVVSESLYRCLDENTPESIASESCPVGLQSIPSNFGSASVVDAPRSPESLRPIKIIVISDYICSFCYLCDKVLRDAIEACRDLPIRFDVEFRPFTLLNPLAPPIPRNSYLIKRFGKEQVEIIFKAISGFAQKTGLRLAEDGIICGTVQAHRLSAKAYQDGGQKLQNKFNGYIFDACLTEGANISDEDFLANAAVHIGWMNKEEATTFLRSRECLDCVEKMVAAAKVQGINGVPFVIIDGKWAVNGLQPVECFIQIFRKLAHLPTPLNVPGKPKTEHRSRVH